MQRENLQDNRLNKPIGSHLVCSYCHTMHIWSDCGHWGEPCFCCERKVVSITPPYSGLGAGFNTPLQVKTPKKEKRKTPPQTWDGVPSLFFAWRSPGFGDNKKKIGKQRGFKNPKSIWYGKKDADYISVAKFKKGGAGKHRTLENLVSIDKVYSDIDAGFSLDWQELIEECEKYNIPKPNLIVMTSPNHYQLRWDIPEINKELLGLWNRVQEGIFNLFEEFGADGQAIDAIRYLRNPDKCEKVYESGGEKTSLSVMYRALMQARLIESIERQEGHKPQRRNQQSFSKVSLPRLRAFFKDNPHWEGTHKELSKRLSIPERSIYYLMPVLYREGLKTETIRVNKTWKTRFTFDTARKEYLNMGGGGSGVYSRALEKAKRVGIAENHRNVGVFVLALWLSVYQKLAPERVVMELEPVFVAIDRWSVDFSRREFEKTVLSACREKYKCFVKFRSEKFQCLIAGLSGFL